MTRHEWALIAFAAEALGISGAEFKRRYGQSRGAAIIAIDSAAIAGRLALIVCGQEEVLASERMFARAAGKATANLREQIAADIEASAYAMTDPYDASAPRLITVDDAARIARGGP